MTERIPSYKSNPFLLLVLIPCAVFISALLPGSGAKFGKVSTVSVWNEPQAVRSGLSSTISDKQISTIESSISIPPVPQSVSNERTVSGVIEKSFFQSAVKQNIPYEVIDSFVDLFSSKVEFRRDLQPGDSFSIIYSDNVQISGRSSLGIKIIAASLENSGKTFAAIRGDSNTGNGDVYFDQTGAPYGNYFLRYPLQFSRITSVFTTARFHPILQVARPHLGVDFAAPIGTPVRAVADAQVSFAGFNGDSGVMVRLKHNSVYETAYLHLSKVAAGVKTGGAVKRGQVIGAVGMTGLATGPHLHFALFKGGTYIDPLKANLPNLAPGLQPPPKTVLVQIMDKLNQARQIASLVSDFMKRLG